jgi:MFS family permease
MPPTPLGEQPGSGSAQLHKGLILFILGVSQLMIVLDITIVNVAINDIRIDLAVTSQTDLQWIITGYTLAFGGLLLLGGKLADRIGRRNIFIAGAALFSFASLLCAVTNSLGLLVAARALQGAGGAMMAPAAL